MKISLNNLELKYLYLLFFILGFNKFILYLPIIVLYFLIFYKNLNYNKSAIIAISLNLITILSIFLIGADRMTLTEPYNLLIVFSFVIIISGLLLQNQKKAVQIKMLAAYILGFGFESSIIAGYSYLFNDGSYGYGNLYDPFTNNNINSPIVSNNLSIFASMLIFYIFNNKNFSLKIVFSLLFLLLLNLGVFLGGRTFFIIIVFSFIYTIIKPVKINKIMFIFSLIILLTAISPHIHEIISIDFILKRFENGLESKRFLHYQHGIQELISHPLGGYSVDQSIEATKWFHNIFLDMGRLAGWIPIFSFTLAILYTLLKSIKKVISGNIHYSFSLLIFIISFVILQQDISIEGDYRSYIILFLSSIILCSTENKYYKK